MLYRKVSFFVVVLSLIFAVCVILPFLWVTFKYTRAECAYIERMERLEVQVPEKLNNYYSKYDRYPEEFNAFSIYSLVSDVNCEVIRDVNYSSDGNSFELVWTYREYLQSHPELVRLRVERGYKGRSTYSDGAGFTGGKQK